MIYRLLWPSKLKPDEGTVQPKLMHLEARALVSLFYFKLQREPRYPNIRRELNHRTAPPRQEI